MGNEMDKLSKVVLNSFLNSINLEKLPEWPDLPNRKSWLFCHEIPVY